MVAEAISLARVPSWAGVRQSTSQKPTMFWLASIRMLVHPVIPMPMNAMFSLSLGGNAPARPRALEERTVKTPALAPLESTSRLENCLPLIIDFSDQRRLSFPEFHGVRIKF